MNGPLPGDRAEASFDLTPMIDVVLLLIIFFMLTSQFTQSNLSPMSLPHARGEKAVDSEQAKPAAVVIDMAIDGALRLNDEAVDADRLLQLVGMDAKRAASAGGAIDVVIRADRDCPAVHLNHLAGTLVRAGVRKWRLATDGEGGASGGSGGRGGAS